MTVAADGSVSYRRPTVVTVCDVGTPKPPVVQPPVDPPTNPPVVQPPLTGVALKASEWAKLVDYPAVKADSAKLAAIYEQIANEIRSGAIQTEFALVSRQMELSQDSLGSVYRDSWRPFTAKLGEYLTAEKIAGRLGSVKVNNHEAVWRQIAIGLRGFSK